MFKTLRKRIPSMSIKKIYQLKSTIFLLSMIVWGPLLIFVYWDLLSHQFEPSLGVILVFIAYLIILFLTVKTLQVVDSGIRDILYEQLDFEKTKAYYSLLLNKKPNMKNFCESVFGVLDFYKGNFEESLQHFKEIDETKWDSYQRFEKRVTNDYYRVLTALQLKNSEEVENTMNSLLKLKTFGKKQEQMKWTMFAKLQNLVKVMQEGIAVEGQVLLYEGDKLDSYLYTYYQAKNALLQGNEDKAKALFTEIKDENPELFYVREAREYLGEKLEMQ